MTVAVLFARRDSCYKQLPDLDVWDADRDALNWNGGCPVVAHPPCRGWGRMRQFSYAHDDERQLAEFAICAVSEWGGVLEHPAESSLWSARGLPRPGRFPDRFGGYSIEID